MARAGSGVRDEKEAERKGKGKEGDGNVDRDRRNNSGNGGGARNGNGAGRPGGGGGREGKDAAGGSKDWDDKVAAAWPQFWKYFNGRSALERVALQEDMKRKDVWNLLTAMSEYLTTVRHW